MTWWPSLVISRPRNVYQGDNFYASFVYAAIFLCLPILCVSLAQLSHWNAIFWCRYSRIKPIYFSHTCMCVIHIWLYTLLSREQRFQLPFVILVMCIEPILHALIGQKSLLINDNDNIFIFICQKRQHNMKRKWNNNHEKETQKNT